MTKSSTKFPSEEHHSIRNQMQFTDSNAETSSMDITLEKWLLRSFEPDSCSLREINLDQSQKETKSNVVTKQDVHDKSEDGKDLELNEEAHQKRQCSRWTRIEDIFLTGIVLDMYCIKHSLKSGKLEDDTDNRGVWGNIHDVYDQARLGYNESIKEELPARSLKALQKRWQDTGNACNKNCFAAIRQTKMYYKIWDEKFNRNQVLACFKDKSSKN